MKPLHVVLSLSAAVNLAALAALTFRPQSTAAWIGRTFSFRSAASSAVPERKTAAATSSPDTTAAMTWADMVSGDLSTLPVRLRAAGFPPELVQGMVHFVVNQQFAARRRALMPNSEAMEYWKNPHQGPASTRTQAELRQLGREQNRLIRDLLGPDSNRRSGEEADAQERRQYGELAPAKIEQIRKIMTDYEEISAKVRDDTMGIMLPEDRAKLALLEKEKRADIERLLTPAELLDYDLRNSNAANELRGRLGRFEPTEAEFRALYEVQKAFTDRFSPGNRDGIPPPPDFLRERQQASQELNDQFAAVLGDRAAEYRQATQERGPMPDEETLDRLVARLELPATTTAAVVSLQQELQPRAAKSRTDRTLSAEDRSAQQAALAVEATTRLTQVLGTRGFEAYKQNGGMWLQVLTRPPPGPAARE